MKKKIAFVLLFITTILLLDCFIFAEPSNWAKESVLRIEMAKILNGDLADSDKMKNEITRAEFAELVSRFYAYIEKEAVESYDSYTPFFDTNSKFVGYAYNMGVVNGVSETAFNPDSKVTREQIAVMIQRAAKKLNLSNAKNKKNIYNDESSISSWAKESVYFCQKENLMKGVSGGVFSPKGSATREQVIKIIDNALLTYDKYKSNKTSLSKAYSTYKIPSASESSLVYGFAPEKNIALWIKAPGNESDYLNYSPEKASMEVYTVLESKWGHDRASSVAKLINDKWILYSLSYPSNETYKVDSNGKVSPIKKDENAEIKIYFNGVAYIYLSK